MKGQKTPSGESVLAGCVFSGTGQPNDDERLKGVNTPYLPLNTPLNTGGAEDQGEDVEDMTEADLVQDI